MVKPLDILIWEGGAEATQKTGTFFGKYTFSFVIAQFFIYVFTIGYS